MKELKGTGKYGNEEKLVEEKRENKIWKYKMGVDEYGQLSKGTMSYEHEKGKVR